MPEGTLGQAGGAVVATAWLWGGDEHDRLVCDW